MERITERVYAREGNARLSCPMSRGRKLVGWCLAATFLICILSEVVLGFLDVFPHQYMQPVSAIYIVPFLVHLVFSKHCHWAHYVFMARALCSTRDFNHGGGPDLFPAGGIR